MTLPPNTDHPEAPEGDDQQPGVPPVAPPDAAAPTAPPAAPPAPQYAAPQPPAAPQPGASPVPGSQPPAAQVPQAPHYGAPQVPGAPVPPQYGTPQPSTPQYGAPQAQPAYGAPAAPQVPGAPAAPQYGAAYQQQYAAPQYAAAAYGAEPGPGGPFDGAVNPDDITRPLYGASFGQAIKRYFQGYVKFNGRASRSEYWWSYLFLAIFQIIPLILVIAGLIAMAASTSSYSYDDYGYSSYGPSGGSIALLVIGGGLLLLIGLGTLLPSIAIGWRRLHDGNFAGPLYLITFASIIPIVNYIAWIGSIAVIVLMIMPSKAEGRRFDQ